MSRWGLGYKAKEILTPEEWNRAVDALQDLDERIASGKAEFTGDGTTTSFKITHELEATPVFVTVGKETPNIPDIDYYTADDVYITVYFKSPPPANTTFRLWWMALKF